VTNQVVLLRLQVHLLVVHLNHLVAAALLVAAHQVLVAQNQVHLAALILLVHNLVAVVLAHLTPVHIPVV